MGWIDLFLQDYKLVGAFDMVWTSFPKHPGVTVPKKPYRLVKQWSGKEMRNLGRVLLAALEATLFGSSSQPEADRDVFEQVLQCVGGLMDFAMMCQYRNHTHDGVFDNTNKFGKPSARKLETGDTLSYMHNYLCVFFDNLPVLSKYRALT